VTLRARWVTLRARWVTLRARWVTLRARWVTLRARWVTLRARKGLNPLESGVWQGLLLALAETYLSRGDGSRATAALVTARRAVR
jgi:hypothetical protein